MAFTTPTILLLATVVLTVAMTADSAGKAAPAPVDCTSVVLGMSDCLSYVSNGSTTETPEGTCCSGLKQVLKTAPDCLCQAYKQSATFGVVLNNTKALQLPAACKVHAPAAASCGLSALSPASAPAGAVGAPAGAPAGAPSSSSATATAPAAGASETSPAASPSKNTSASVRVSLQLVLAVMVAAFFSIF